MHRQPLFAAGGKPPYTWSVIAGSTPAGLELDSDSGVISGNPTTQARAVFTAQVADDAGNTEMSDLALTIDPERRPHRSEEPGSQRE